MGYTSALRLVAVALVCCAALAVAETADQPTSTNPPSALPTGSNSTLCAFNDRNSLMERVASDWQGGNISLLVQTCDNVCALIYGSGNPDISGVGAMISYSIQGVVTILLGPVFTVFVVFFNLNRAESSYSINSTYHLLYQIGTEIAWCAFQINIFLAVSIAIATMARFLQVVPVAEVVFLASLVQYEVYVLAAGFCSSTLLFKSFRNHPGIYSLIFSLMVFCPLITMRIPSDTSPILADIMRSCATVRDYPSPNTLICSIELLLMLITATFTAATFFIFSASKCDVNVPRADYRARKSGFCSAIRVCSRWWGALTISFGTIVWTTMMVFSFIDLQSNRRKLQDLSNGAYQEEQWGFGQVMAILAWVPFFQDFFVKGVFGVAKHIYRQRQQQQQQQQRAQNQDGTPLQDLATATQCQIISSQTASTGDIADHQLASIREEALADSHGNTEHGTSPTTSVFLRPSPLRRSLSLEQSLPQSLRSRSSWPRNQDGAYLPIRK